MNTNTPANRLAREKSPYLLQHRYNPVNWYPWGDEAFDRARSESKPIFLSVGYSTCHWCHVMERESFEDRTIADFLNAHFVAIKVDREERPDVDGIYVAFVQAMAGQAGWPLNVFLAPDLKPFYGGTYWPPDEKYGRPGFMTVLRRVHSAWEADRASVLAAAADIHSRLDLAIRRSGAGEGSLDEAVLKNAGAWFKQGYDRVNGGWEGAPKFPMPSRCSFLLRYGTRFGDREAVEMVLYTCDRMAAGGIHDLIGGGFHRYSTDEEWLVPHFEKMLYDNAQLLGLYLDCHAIGGGSGHAEIARDIAGYVLRDMTSPEGGFYSAEDADSEGKEGKFYCWTRDELSRFLRPEEFEAVVEAYGVTEDGNFLDHSDPAPLPKQNVLSMRDASASAARGAPLISARKRMFEERARRVRPHRDDKVLVSWNGLMAGALSRAAVLLDEPAYLEAAEKNAAFLKSKLWEPRSKTLYHRWRDGDRDTVQLLESYAFLASGMLDLYQATLKAGHLDFAVALGEGMVERFYDARDGGFWQSAPGATDLILRVKEDFDGAIPSGNSVAVCALLKLAAITGRADLREAAEKSLRLFGERMAQIPLAVPNMLSGLDLLLDEAPRVVIAGDPDSPESRMLLRAAHVPYLPNKAILGNSGAVDEFARTLPLDGGGATAYLCAGSSCRPPTRDPEEVARFLRRDGGSREA
jgi:uncharacterized protein YyaL (SSP411 family)